MHKAIDKVQNSLSAGLEWLWCTQQSSSVHFAVAAHQHGRVLDTITCTACLQLTLASSTDYPSASSEACRLWSLVA